MAGAKSAIKSVGYFNDAFALTGTALNLIDIIPGVEIPPGILDVFNILNDDPTTDLLNEMSGKLDEIYGQGVKILDEIDQTQRLSHEIILQKIRSSAKNAQEQLKIYTDAGGDPDARSEALNKSAEALNDAQEYAQSSIADAALAIPALLAAIGARVNVIREIGDGATSGEFKGDSGTGLTGAIRTLEKSVQSYKDQLPDLIKYQADVTFDSQGANPSYLVQIYIVDGPEKKHIGNDVVYVDYPKHQNANVSDLSPYINFQSGAYTDSNQDGGSIFITRSGMDVTDISGLIKFSNSYERVGDNNISDVSKLYLQYYIYPQARQLELEASVDALKQLVSGQYVKDVDGTNDGTIQAVSNIPDTFEKWPGFTAPHTLEGRAGNDIIIGSGGNDTLRGGGGSVNYSIYGVVGDGNDHLYGKGGDDIMIGGTGNDWLDGGTGNDRMNGGAGIDMASYASASTGVTVSLDLQDWQETGFGKDRLSDIEDLEGSNFGDTLTGSVGNNTIFGLAGNDVIDGHQGADRMIGGTGNDTYIVDNVGDIVVEATDQGTDTVKTNLTSYTLTGDVENLTYTGRVAFTGAGNDLDNIFHGGAGANTFNGSGGDDQIFAGTGTNILSGGTGNDYYVLNAAADKVIENANEGRDTVYVGFDYTLGNNIEQLVVTNISGVNITGNDIDNAIYGNNGNDVFHGGLGDDYIVGGGGDDLLYGDAGTNTLLGGTGNDYYVLNSAFDTVIENVGEGRDTVYVDGFAYTLTANVEQVVTTGIGTASVTGNALDNVFYGGSGINTFNGAGGSDQFFAGTGTNVLLGGKGNDYYVLNSAADTVIENVGEGRDTVYVAFDYTLAANVEQAVVTSTGTIGVTGNALDNAFYGNSGTNTFNGQGGNDYMVGGGSSDVFVFLAGFGRDIVADFASGQDRAAVDHTQFANFTAIQSHAAQVGSDTVITYDAANTITLQNVSVADLHAGDFLFV